MLARCTIRAALTEGIDNFAKNTHKNVILGTTRIIDPFKYL